VYTMAASIEVNPAGVDVALTRDLVWHGLVMKAENALPFVPAMQECTVMSRSENGLVRSVMTRGERFTERVTFTPQVQVLFDRTDGTGADAGWIANVLSDGQRGLLLTFVLNVVIPDVQPGSPDELRRGEAIKASYVEAIEATLRMMRTLAGTGALRA
jgi:Domain of unknown function (DUF1857)